MDTPSRSQAFTYIAASKNSADPYRDTELYRFRLINGAMERVNEVPVYGQGYEALAYRSADGMLYAMDHAAEKRNLLLVIDPKSGNITQREVSGMPPQNRAFVLGDIAPDGKTYVIGGAAESATVKIDLTQTQLVAEATGGVPGSGGHYDWAFHPVDKRLYAVDGDTGELLTFRLSAKDQKQVLAKAFPKAQGPGKSGAYRPVYGAVFFSDKGVMYAIDTAGNVYELDLTKSTAEKPIAGDDILKAKVVGGGAIKIEKGLHVIDAAGNVLTPKITPHYTGLLTISAALRNTSQASWLQGKGQVPPGYIYAWRLTLIARKPDTKEEADVKDYRIQFVRPTNSEIVEAGDLRVEHGEEGPNAMVYLKSKQDRFIRAGQSLDIDCQVFIQGNKVEAPVLAMLAANRITEPKTAP